MKRLSSILVVVAIIAIVVGYSRGWYTLSGGREPGGNKVDVNLTVDPDKVKVDAETLKDKTARLSDGINR